jgi:hypothetical protein
MPGHTSLLERKWEWHTHCPPLPNSGNNYTHFQMVSSFVLFETKSHYVDQAGLELAM